MSEFFVSSDADEKVAEIIEKKGTPGKKYLKVQLSSLGQFDVPAVVHVKDYSGEDAMDLTKAETNEDVLEILVDIIRKNKFEDFNPGDLHPYDLEEIMMNIFVNWWSNAITDYPYNPTEEELSSLEDQERATRIREGKEKFTVDIPVSLLKTKNVDERVTEPLTINYLGDIFKFRLSRVKDLLNAKKFIEEKYKREDSDFLYLEQDLEYNRQLDDQNSDKPKRTIKKENLDKYIKLQKKKSSDYLKAIQSSLILYIKDEDGEEECSTLKKQIQVYNRVPLQVWERYNQIVEDYCSFGIIKKITVKSPVTGKPVTKEFQFRYLEYLPSVGKRKESPGFTVSFGNGDPCPDPL